MKLNTITKSVLLTVILFTSASVSAQAVQVTFDQLPLIGGEPTTCTINYVPCKFEAICPDVVWELNLTSSDPSHGLLVPSPGSFSF